MHDLVIVGAGGHGRETLDIVEALNAVAPTWRFVGFIDDQPADDTDPHDQRAARLRRRDTAIIGETAAMADLEAHYVIGIGDSAVRARLDDRLTAWGRTAATLVHPGATVASDNRLAPGVLVAAGAHITTNVTLGRHVHCNVASVVSHDCVVGDHATLSPGVHLNGDVTIGARTFLGTGAIVTPGVTIGDDAVIGAGAVVVHDVPPGVTVTGVPGRW